MASKDLRTPPHALDAEESILGGLMLDPRAWDEVDGELEAEDFYHGANQKVYGAIQELNRRNLPIDIITVSNFLKEKNLLEQAGGAEYLIDLLNKTVSSANIATYTKIVKDKALLRKVIHTSSGIIERAFNQEFEDVNSFVDSVEAEMFQIANKRVSEGLVDSMSVIKHSLEKIEELYTKKAEVTGISTGFRELDKMTAGLHAGEMTIIAARPSMGKTAFSLNIALEAALRQKKSVAYFSVEMGKESIMMRMLATEARISMGEIRTGRIPDSHWPKLIHTAGVMSEARLFLDDTSGISPFEIRARCRRLKAQHGLDLIMIDYLQLMDLKQKVESRERAVSEISKTLKAIARELEVPVIALAQLNRGVEGRTDRRPMLSDLRESGSIEQDADVIMMLYREDYYDRDDPEKQGRAKVIVGKQRNGATGEVDLHWDAKFGRFTNPEPKPEHPMPPPAEPPGPNIPSGGKPRNFAPGASV